jgi:hypothetical protein
MGQEELKKKLEEKRNHLNEWLLRHKQAGDIAPHVQIIKEITDWEMDAISNQPNEANQLPLNDIENTINNECESLFKNLPMMPQYNLINVTIMTSVSTPGSSGFYGRIVEVGKLGTPESQSYSEKYTKLYHVLQEQQQRPIQVRDLIEKLNNPGTLQRFDNTLKAYSNVKAGIAERTSAANEMRNLLQGIKGCLFEQARKQPRENMTWSKMVQRLSKHGPAEAEYNLLISQEKTHEELISNLSTISKDREISYSLNLEHIWTRILDHLYAVLSLVQLPTP